MTPPPADHDAQNDDASGPDPSAVAAVKAAFEAGRDDLDDGDEPQDDAPRSGGGWLATLLLAVLSLVLYWPSAEYGLIYDDLFLISPQLNESMQPVVDDLGATLDLFGQEYWAGVNPDQAPELRTRGQALYRPLTLFVWGVTLNLWHGHDLTLPFDTTRAAAYHWISILTNLLIVVLLHRLARTLFDNPRLAFLAALIYAVHPLHVEAVAYVAGFSDQLATLAVVVGLLCFERATRGTGVRPLWSLLLIATLFVGMLAKESAVLLLAACFLTDLMWAARGRAVGMARRAVLYGGMLGALGLHIWVRLIAVGYLRPDANVISRLDNVLINVDTVPRVFNSLKLIAKYVWLVLWPKDLSIDYSFATIEVSEKWTSPEPLAGTILVAAMLIVGLLKLRRSPALGWGLLFFVGCTTFTSNMLVPIGTVFAERLMYLPTLGAAVALGVVADRLIGRRGAPANPLGVLLVVIAVGLLGMRTWQRSPDFKDTLTVFEAAKEVVPNSARVHYQLGTLYSNQQLFDEATSELEQTLLIDQTFIQAAIRLGDVHLARRNFEKADETFTRILDNIRQLGAATVQETAVRALVLRKRSQARRQRGELDLAEQDLADAIALGADDTYKAALQYARLLQGQEKFAESIAVIERGLSLDPDNIELLLLLSRAAVATSDQEAYASALDRLEATPLGRPAALSMRAEVMYEQASAEQNPAKRDEAMGLFEQALALNDKLPAPFVFRGRYMVERTRSFYDAIVQFDNALERDPDNGPALLHKSLAQLQVGDAEGALVTLQRLETVNPSVACYALLAETYFRLGDLEGQEEMNRRLRELGKEPLQTALNRAKSLRDRGDATRAIELLDQLLVDPEYSGRPELLRSYGILMLDVVRCDEALAYFQQQEAALAMDEQAVPDLFLPVNKARALTCLGRLDEAEGMLFVAEGALSSLADQPGAQRGLQSSILHRRAELLLARGEAAAAESVASQALEATNRGYPPIFDLSIATLVAMGDLDAAVNRTREAETLFFKLAHYPLVLEAIERAQAGDPAGGAALLDGYETQTGYFEGGASVARIADQLRKL